MQKSLKLKPSEKRIN